MSNARCKGIAFLLSIPAKDARRPDRIFCLCASGAEQVQCARWTAGAGNPRTMAFTGWSLTQARMMSQMTSKGASVFVPSGLACVEDTLYPALATQGHGLFHAYPRHMPGG